MKKDYPNGGFPPLKYCIVKKKTKKKDESYEFAPDLNNKNNINIREILNNKSTNENNENKENEELIVINEI